MGNPAGGRGTEPRVGGAGPSLSLSLSLPSRGSSWAEAASSAASSAASARPAAISPHGPGAEAGAGPLRRRRCFLLHLAPGGPGRAGQVKSLLFLPPGEAASSPPGRCLRPGPSAAGWSRLGRAPEVRVFVREVLFLP